MPNKVVHRAGTDVDDGYLRGCKRTSNNSPRLYQSQKKQSFPRLGRGRGWRWRSERRADYRNVKTQQNRNYELCRTGRYAKTGRPVKSGGMCTGMFAYRRSECIKTVQWATYATGEVYGFDPYIATKVRALECWKYNGFEEAHEAKYLRLLDLVGNAQFELLSEGWRLHQRGFEERLRDGCNKPRSIDP